MKSKILLKENAIHGTALIPIAIHHLSYKENEENFFYLHWHYEFEFIAVLEGAIVYTIEDKDYIVMAGEGLFIHSNQLHAARSYNGMPCEASVVLFHPNLFGDSKQGAAYSKFVYPILKEEREFNKHFTSQNEWQRKIIELIKEMDPLRNENLSENELILKSKLFEIWHLCYKNSGFTAPRYRSEKNYKLDRMQPVLDYIQENYKDEIVLEDLARIIPMSKGQFCHCFKEVMNMPPIAYIIRYRILKSCSLLNETDWKISDIARNIGFNNISYFNREFIKAIGCSPSQYRKEG
ncbi:helix-turn-helix transcriptional regulator [Clostridium sp. 19966]|uniref:AraC family transcriptional regulator n=1 Tax=Clostridium sp. 19966 TaxID=2768166 RepID=UPI0028DDEDBA|nr:AraC family transcriptional regulator [Clostridium sp. 19966]MDT8719252.1 helix-turn-helix transcriptional regulator [Clostridium sp. 19966]